ncbi:Electrogenic sodium bicarbonate cotransporter 4 [Cichlidogyrus casuarinus]|uniref:Electrogenic sodium bicarbonate cotransporter 4 n=1 Tax=Cichlidogyrus casuarinus TaxID=1844966 RepID=A0ABD2PL94_9PLAT
MDQTEGRVRFSEVEVNVNPNIEITLPSIFVELDELRVEQEDIASQDSIGHHWLQRARWVKFEENYDETSKRFSDAHVSPLKFQDIIEFRTLIDEHLTIVDCNEAITTISEAMQELASKLHEDGAFVDENDVNYIYELFMAKRYHPDVKTQSSLNTQKPDKSKVNEGFTLETRSESILLEKVYGRRKFRFLPLLNSNSESELFNIHLGETFHTYSESCCVLSARINILVKPILALVRLDMPILEPGLVEVNIPVRFLFFCLGPTEHKFNYNELGRCFAVMLRNRVRTFDELTALFRNSVNAFIPPTMDLI